MAPRFVQVVPLEDVKQEASFHLEDAERREYREFILARALAGLSKRELSIIIRRYGLLNECLKRTEIAPQLGVTPSRVAQIENRAFRKMRSRLSADHIRAEDVL